MSDIIVIDDDTNRVERPRRRRPAVAQPIVIDESDADTDSHEHGGAAPVKRKSRKNTRQPSGDSEDGTAPKPKRQRQQKTPKQVPENRTNAAGVTVRFSAQPSQAIYQRIQRALPGTTTGCLSFLGSLHAVPSHHSTAQYWTVLACLHASVHPADRCPSFARQTLAPWLRSLSSFHACCRILLHSVRHGAVCGRPVCPAYLSDESFAWCMPQVQAIGCF